MIINALPMSTISLVDQGTHLSLPRGCMTIARVAGCLNNPGRNQEGEMMKRVRMRWVATAGLVAAAGCGGVAQQGAESPTPRTFSVPIYDAQAQQVGQL